MPDKTEKSAAPKVIKWTEEEWASVANHLFGQKGAVLLSSPRLEEIRAKDVFLAQETLPEDRHRKLISIAQGFQGIRDRLSTIFQGMGQASQNELFNQSQPQQQPDAPATESAPAETQDIQPGQEQKRPVRERKPRGHDASMTQAEQPQAQPETTTTVAAPAVPATAPQAEQAAAAQDKPTPVQNAQNVQAEQPQRRPEQNSGMQGGRDRQRERGNEGRPQFQPQPQPQPQPQQAANAQATAGFLEAARPFVAMVCEEMALALVKAFAAKGGEQQFGNMLQKALAQFAPNQANGQSPRPERQNQPRHERAFQAQAQPQVQPQSFSAAMDMPDRAMASDAVDEDGGHPAEVQPLFDPKLPPSANSDFKPTIGLVGSNIRELDDLQLLYPQLRLTVVAPDAVRSADVFRQCQRIIGLREDVAQPVDELLRRLLRNRYIRIAGGIPRVREQLNSWLHNPNSINAEPRPHVPRGPKGPNQGQGQGQGDGGGKKRHNRHLRSPR